MLEGLVSTGKWIIKHPIKSVGIALAGATLAATLAYTLSGRSSVDDSWKTEREMLYEKRRIESELQHQDLVNAPKNYKFNRHVEVENEGDPSVGTIHYIRQLHKDLFSDSVDSKTAMYQYNILKELDALGYNHIFAEGNTEDTYSRGTWVTEFIKEDFNDGIPEKPNAEQLRNLYLYGAASVYAVINPDVVLHKADDYSANSRAVFRIIASVLSGEVIDPGDETLKRDMDIDREQAAIESLSGYLSEHPGDSVVLIYGGAHEFKDNLTSDFNPRLYCISFVLPATQAIKTAD